jgi:hypothetical protein
MLVATWTSGLKEQRKIKNDELDDVAVKAVGEEDSLVRRVGDSGDDLQDLGRGAAEGE